MKKISVFFLSLLIILSACRIFVSADSPESLKTYTLTEIRQMALRNAEQLDTYQALYKKYHAEMLAEESQLGEAYQVYEDNGKLVTKYSSGQALSEDYRTKLENFDKIIRNLKKQNELAAIQKYNDILICQIDIQKKNNAIELAALNLSISKKSFELGHMTKLQYESAKADVASLKAESKQLQAQLDALFEDLNRIIGLPRNTRYTLDKDQLLTAVKNDQLHLSVPTDALAYVRKDSDALKELQKKLSERKKEMEIYSKTHLHIPKIYQEKEKALDIEGLEKEYKNTGNALYFSLESEYLEILTTLLRLSNFKDDMDFQRYENNIRKLNYQKGLISKKTYLHEQDHLLNLEQDLITQILQSYQKIIHYQIKTGTAVLPTSGK